MTFCNNTLHFFHPSSFLSNIILFIFSFFSSSLQHTNGFDKSTCFIEETIYNLNQLPVHSRVEEYLNKGKYIIPFNYPHHTHWILIVLVKRNVQEIDCYIEDPMSGTNYKELEDAFMSWIQNCPWREKSRRVQEPQEYYRKWILRRPFVYNKKSKIFFKSLLCHTNFSCSKRDRCIFYIVRFETE